MSVPSHGSGCYSKTIPVNCHHCGERIYYFSCNCGSRVLFDKLGNDWPIHHCQEYFVFKAIELCKGNANLTDNEIFDTIINFSRRNNIPIPDALEDTLSRHLKTRKHTITVERVTCSGSPTAIYGRIHAINKSVNLFTRMGIRSNPMMKGLLGSLADKKYAEIQVRTSPDINYNCKEYSILIEEPELKKYNVQLRKQMLFGLTDSESFKKEWVVTQGFHLDEME